MVIRQVKNLIILHRGKPVYRNAFGGLAQIIIKSDGSSNPVTLTVKSDGLKDAHKKINVISVSK